MTEMNFFSLLKINQVAHKNYHTLVKRSEILRTELKQTYETMDKEKISDLKKIISEKEIYLSKLNLNLHYLTNKIPQLENGIEIFCQIDQKLQAILRKMQIVHQSFESHEKFLIASLKIEASFVQKARENKWHPTLPYFPDAIPAYQRYKSLVSDKKLTSSTALKQMAAFFRPATSFVSNERLPRPQTIGSLIAPPETLRHCPGLWGDFSPCDRSRLHTLFMSRKKHDQKDKIWIALLKKEEVEYELIRLKLFTGAPSSIFSFLKHNKVNGLKKLTR